MKKSILEITYTDKNHARVTGFNRVEMNCTPYMATQFAKGYIKACNLIVLTIIVLDENQDIFAVIRNDFK